MAEAENLDTSAALDTSGAENKGTGTIFDEGKEVAKPSNVVWPEDWRKRFAGDDEKLLKKAERFTDPVQVFKSLTEAEKRISQGFKPVELTDKSTPEEVAEYRKQNGIPEEWTGYQTDLGNGVVFGDADKPVIDHFLEFAHSAHFPQKYVTQALTWYNELQQDQVAMIEEADLDHKTNAAVHLKEEWGPDYKANLNAIKGTFESFEEGLYAKLFSARSSAGMLLGNDPAVVKAFAALARQVNPAAMIMPGSVDDSAKSIDSELSDIQAEMAKPGYRYLSAEERDKKFQRLMDLNAAKERLAKR